MSRWGVALQDPAWALAAVACSLAVWGCAGAARRRPQRHGVWSMLGTANVFGALAALLAVVVAAAGHGATAALYLGLGGSLGLLAGAGFLARQNLPGARLDQLGDAVLLATLAVALGGFCVAIPGFQHGDSLLTLVFLVDLAAVLLGALATLAGSGGRERMVGWSIVAGCATAAIGDGLPSASAAGLVGNVVSITAVLWAGTGFAVVVAARLDRDEPAPPAGEISRRRWVLVRVVLPLVAVLALPAAAGVVA